VFANQRLWMFNDKERERERDRSADIALIKSS
jgi:hypothetical protein